MSTGGFVEVVELELTNVRLSACNFLHISASDTMRNGNNQRRCVVFDTAGKIKIYSGEFHRTGKNNVHK
jgi:hypothetical protein